MHEDLIKQVQFFLDLRFAAIFFKINNYDNEQWLEMKGKQPELHTICLFRIVVRRSSAKDSIQF